MRRRNPAPQQERSENRGCWWWLLMKRPTVRRESTVWKRNKLLDSNRCSNGIIIHLSNEKGEQKQLSYQIGENSTPTTKIAAFCCHKKPGWWVKLASKLNLRLNQVRIHARRSPSRIHWVIDGFMDGQIDGWMDGWMVGRMDGRMDGWMDGWTDGWMMMDGWWWIHRWGFVGNFKEYHFARRREIFERGAVVPPNRRIGQTVIRHASLRPRLERIWWSRDGNVPILFVRVELPAPARAMLTTGDAS